MIKHLQKRLIITLTFIFTLFFWVILFMFNYAHYRFNLQQSFTQLHQLDNPHLIERREKQPDISPERKQEDMMNRLSVCVLFYEDKELQIGENNQITNYSEEELLDYADSIMEQNKQEGRFQNFLYLKKANAPEQNIMSEEPASPKDTANLPDSHEAPSILYIMDISPAMERIRDMTLFSIVLGIIGFLVLLGIAFLLSAWLIRPAETAFAKQKQFISDASHELKTPLTVIGANAELLESEIGSNKWLGYIHSETKRMSCLVNDLLSLARLENPSDTPVFSEFSLSHAATSILLPFESVAFEQGIYLDLDIREHIHIVGAEEQLKQVISILTDNALRHTKPEGTVKINIQRKHQKVLLTVSNTGEPIPPEEQERIFDRFYRSSSSRERSEGRYGLGLAIARAITLQHKGSMKVKCENGWTSFCLELPSTV